MMIGPFWCEKQNSWVRFVNENDKFYAELARRNSQNPAITDVWKKTETPYWFVDYSVNSNSILNEAFALHDGKLYWTNFSIGALSQILTVSIYDKEGKSSPFNIFRAMFNPFEGQSNSPNAVIAPFENLPLTPEKQVDLARKKEQDASKALEERKQKWQNWQNTNIRDGIVIENNTLLFNANAKAALSKELETVLLHLDAKNYATPELYLQALDSAIHDENNAVHKEIMTFVAQTNFDRDLNLNPTASEELRAKLFEHKQIFIYNFVQAEREQLNREFDLKSESAKQVLIKKLAMPRRQAPAPNVQPQVPQNPVPQRAPAPNAIVNQAPPVLVVPNDNADNEALQRALLASMFDNDAPVADADDSDLNRAIALSLQPNSRPQPVLGNSTRDLIHAAVIVAQAKYAKWYKAEEAYRGDNGFFTWFRHGSYGQKRALTLRDDLALINHVDDVTDRVNEFLTDGETRYERHSFSSFLLDELKGVAGTPWHGLAPDQETNLYDMQQVHDQLAFQAIPVR